MAYLEGEHAPSSRKGKSLSIASSALLTSHHPKVSTSVIKGAKTVEQVRSWWSRTWDCYLKVKEAVKHTGGGDGDDTDSTSTSESEVEVDKVTGKKTRKRINAREKFAKSYVFDQIDHV
jgi:hypothetical protein